MNIASIENAEKICGWMLREELLWLAAQAQQRFRIVEIGSYMGRSTRALAENTPGTVTAVDTWRGSVEHAIDLSGKPENYLLETFKKNVGDLIESGKVEPLEMTSLQAAKKFTDEGRKFDMVFIDASHLYDDAKTDIRIWKKLLAPGGIICGHDYSRYSGLDSAVKEEAAGFRMMPWPGSIWFVGDAVGESRPSPRLRNLGVRKVLFTLNVGMNFSPEICSLTYPLLRLFADKCGADFHIITERRYPWMPITYEKLQIFELGQEMGNDWNIFFDSDALIHPDTYDPTEHITKDTVMHNGHDMAGNRWKYDKYFRRDGRHIGSGNWFSVASDWCIDLWRPPDDIAPEEIVKNVTPTVFEQARGIKAEHLIDDYILSRNIAKFGLKFMSYLDLTNRLGRQTDEYFWHHYTVPIQDTVAYGDLPDEKSPQFQGDFLKLADGTVMRKGKITLIGDVLKRWGLNVNGVSESSEQRLADELAEVI